MKMSSRVSVILAFTLIFFISSTLFAATPPGLSKSVNYPKGLQDKTPAGWSKGKKKGWNKTKKIDKKTKKPKIDID